MPESPADPPLHSWRETALDAAGAAFFPAVVFLTVFHAVVVANARELLYHYPLAGAFTGAGVAAWVVGFLILRRYRARLLARLWLAVPWLVLLMDVAGAQVARWVAPVPMAIVADLAVALVVLAAAATVRWSTWRAAAAVAGIGLLVQGGVAHFRFLHGLSPDLVAGSAAAIPSRMPAVPAGLPGNVYHILLDAYQSETFAALTEEDARARFPGFTFYSRFNTNFPRTESSELALLHGRPPRPGLSVKEWPAMALREGFWPELATAGVGLWLYPYGRWLCPDVAVKCLASTDMEREVQATVTRDATIDLWALRLVPTSLRRVLDPRQSGGGDRAPGFSLTSAWRQAIGQKPEDAPAGLTALPMQHFNLLQFEALLADEVRRPARGQYVYYHALIPHPEYMRDEQCKPVTTRPLPTYGPAYWAFARCANLMIERLTGELDRLGRLDDALVIVHADHGDMAFLVAPQFAERTIEFALDRVARQYQQPDTAYQHDGALWQQLQEGDSAGWRSIAVEIFSSGLLLAKPPGASINAEDERPVQLLDIAPTILAHFGRPHESYPGTPLWQVPMDRESVFYAHNRGVREKLSRYRLTAEGWRFVDNVPVVP